MAYCPDEGQRHNEAMKKRVLEEREELGGLLSNAIGRRHIFRILEDSFIFATTFEKNSKSFFNEGKRDAALKLFNAVLDLDPYIFAKMCVEFRDKLET